MKPLERIYNLGSLGRAGDEVLISVLGDELAKLARWAGVREVTLFEARIALRRLSATRISYDTDLRTRFVQDCVVSLEPVETNLNRRIHRELHLTERAPVSASEDVVIDPEPEVDDVSEDISDLRYDLAKPLLEELVLAIDPYPRAPGAAFVSPTKADGDRPNPFAVLKNLKKQG